MSFNRDEWFHELEAALSELHRVCILQVLNEDPRGVEQYNAVGHEYAFSVDVESKQIVYVFRSCYLT
jgi:hypothetical protein